MRTSALPSIPQFVTHRPESWSAPLSEEWELCVWVWSPTACSPELGWKRGKEEERETSSPHGCCPCFGLIRSLLANRACLWLEAPTPWVSGALGMWVSGCTLRSTQCALPDITGSDTRSSWHLDIFHTKFFRLPYTIFCWGDLQGNFKSGYLPKYSLGLWKTEASLPHWLVESHGPSAAASPCPAVANCSSSFIPSGCSDRM